MAVYQASSEFVSLTFRYRAQYPFSGRRISCKVDSQQQESGGILGRKELSDRGGRKVRKSMFQIGYMRKSIFEQ